MKGCWRVERVLMLKQNCWPEEFQLFKTVQSIIFLRVWESLATALD